MHSECHSFPVPSLQVRGHTGHTSASLGPASGSRPMHVAVSGSEEMSGQAVGLPASTGSPASGIAGTGTGSIASGYDELVRTEIEGRRDDPPRSGVDAQRLNVAGVEHRLRARCCRAVALSVGSENRQIALVLAHNRVERRAERVEPEHHVATGHAGGAMLLMPAPSMLPPSSPLAVPSGLTATPPSVVVPPSSRGVLPLAASLSEQPTSAAPNVST